MQLNYNILIVDDVIDNIQVAMNILKEENYNFSYATSGEEALKLLRNNRFDLVLLDIMMPGMDGYTVCSMMKQDPVLKDIPVIFLTAKNDIDSIAQAFRVGGVDYIIKPFHPEELIARTKTHLELYTSKQQLKIHNIAIETKLRYKSARLLSEVEESQRELIHIVTKLIEATSDETGQHIKRVADYSKLLARYHPALGEEEEKLIFLAAPMHDVGKVLLPSKILNKEGKLTTEEFEVIKNHPRLAHEMLRFSERKLIKAADIIAHQHHERWDGSGYPRGLKGEEIHIFGRIVALADVFDALSQKRTYKEAWEFDRVVTYIKQESGRHFDPFLVEIFLDHLEEFKELMQEA